MSAQVRDLANGFHQSSMEGIAPGILSHPHRVTRGLLGLQTSTPSSTDSGCPFIAPKRGQEVSPHFCVLFVFLSASRLSLLLLLLCGGSIVFTLSDALNLTLQLIRTPHVYLLNAHTGSTLRSGISWLE